LNKQSSMLAALGLALAVTNPLGAAPAPYEINTILPLTGPAAFIGKEENEAFDALEKSVNRSGGVRGQPIHFAVVDDGSNPSTAVQLSNALIAKKVPVIMGSSLVAICNAMAPLMKDATVQYCLSPGIHPPKGSYTFSSSVSTRDLAFVATRYFRERGWTRAAMLTSTDATGQDAENNFDAAFASPENKPMSLVSREHFATTDVSVAAQLASIKAAKPQVMIAWTTGTPFGTVLRAITESGIDTPILGGNGNLTHAQMHQYAQFLPSQLYFPGGLYLMGSQGTRGRLGARLKQFYEALAPTKPDIGHSLAWDPGLIVIEALRKFGTSMNAQQLHEYIEGLHDFVGVNGIYDFRDGSQRGVGEGLVVQWDNSKDDFIPVSKPTLPR
jgi:branched-chain amino acid transport system substrate-binding protein